jgi:chromosomal replication initiator protein
MDTWEKVLTKVEEKVNLQSYNTWFKPTQFIRREGAAIYIRVPNSFFRDWLNEHVDVVLEAARSAGVGDIDVVYMIEESQTKPELPSQGSLDFESVDNTLNPKYSFDTFVVGSSNQFAHAAALAVAERPSKAYNPLFMAVVSAQTIHARHRTEIASESKLATHLYFTEKFTNDLIMQSMRQAAFPERYRTPMFFY